MATKDVSWNHQSNATLILYVSNNQVVGEKMQSPPIAFASMFSKYHVVMNISKSFAYKNQQIKC